MAQRVKDEIAGEDSLPFAAYAFGQITEIIDALGRAKKETLSAGPVG